MTLHKKSLFVFRRDLRLEDNTGLIHALKTSETIIPCFIYDDFILKKFKDSTFRLDFLNESLRELDLELKKKNSSLQMFEGNPSKVIEDLITENNHTIDAVFLNVDFTSYSRSRDAEIHSICKKNNVNFYQILDFLLHNPNDIKTNNHDCPYTVYSFFNKKARQYHVRKIQRNYGKNYSDKITSKTNIRDNISTKNLKTSGGRKAGMNILKNLDKFRDYKNTRDFPEFDGATTKLAPHNKFGTVSIREVYHAIRDTLGPNHTLINEIYWREFFSYISFHFPWTCKKSFQKRFQNIPWSQDKEKFHIWTQGMTGFPIVDAGMRQLNNTGFMHNRVRMIVASFLTKDLHIDWRWGEQYFAEKLVDYDPAVNVGNWQWAASTGCDAVPYFRIFNPWIQQQKFDPDCFYIKRWIPELEELTPKQIHNLWNNFPDGDDVTYVKPILDHKAESQKTKEMFKEQQLYRQ